MRRIWKYTLKLTDTQLEVPLVFKPLSVNEQRGVLSLWAEVVPSNEHMSTRTICVRATGETLKGNEGRFIGTAIMPSGEVYHVYDGS